MGTNRAAARWSESLAAWAIPDELIAAAPESPWGFPVEMFRVERDPVGPVSRDLARAALPPGGSVLDVGCGGGAAALALVPPASSIVGVDDAPGMVEEFSAAAAARGIKPRTVRGTWPAVADEVDDADVVVCHHVFYNVADLVPFAAALTRHARRRVVVELTAAHPLVATRELWSHFHGIDRPTGPTADDAVAVLQEAGVDVQVQRWQRPPRDVPRDVYVQLYRRRLCLTADADPEIDRLVGHVAWPRDVATLWWDPIAE